MLRLTVRAAEAIRELTARAGMQPGSGLRISAQPGGPRLVMTLAERPTPGDRVVPQSRAVVYLDSAAVERLRDTTLDARRNGQGVAFFVRSESRQPSAVH